MLSTVAMYTAMLWWRQALLFNDECNARPAPDDIVLKIENDNDNNYDYTEWDEMQGLLAAQIFF